MAVFLDSNRPRDSVEHVVIHVHGKERDGAGAWRDMASARAQLTPAQAAKTLIVAPQFFNGLDKDRFGHTQPLVWKANTWGEGAPSQRRKDSGPGDVSSFEALDALVVHFSTYPSVRKITMSGHSLGAQLVQRYSVLGRTHRRPITYVVMNPATFLYLTSDRPGPACPDMDVYKYGLEGVESALSCYGGVADRTELVRRVLAEREVHFLHAEADVGVGYDRPPALAQGANRLERARHYQAHLDELAKQARLSPKWTVDWIPHVTHDAFAMTTSRAAMTRIFNPA